VATDLGAAGALTWYNGLTINRHANGLEDQDWYRWSMPASGTFNFNVTGIFSDGDLWVRVFQLNADNTLTEIANSTLTGGATTQGGSVSVLAGQEIYVWVFGFNHALGTYVLADSLT
jgi:hypothetical protein